MTASQFARIYALLAVQLRHPEVGTPTVGAFFKVLADLPVELVAAAADQFAAGAALNDQGQAWFPRAPEWRALAQKIGRERLEQQRAQLRAAPAPFCATCDDTGWARETDHDGIERVHRCACQSQRRAERLGHTPPQITGGPR